MATTDAKQLLLALSRIRQLEAIGSDLLTIAKEYHGWDDPLHTRAMPDCPKCRTIAKAEGRE